ncbi:MAG: hypothetical protein JHC33_01675 [Ignisphaera sp.]|nr:hypothetical protein [Ignisphaera sp.]
MGVLDRLADWYRRQVALATGDVKKYVSAEKTVKTVAVASPLLALIGYLVFYPLFKNPIIGAIIVAVLALAPWFTVIDVATSVQSFSKEVEEEAPFVVAMVAGVANTGMELIEALRFLTRTRVFKAFKTLADRFWSLSEALGASEGLRLLSRMLRGRGRLFMLEYASTLASGTALHYLRDRAVDFVKSAGVEFERSMTTRMMMAMMVSMIFAVLPVVLISISTLYTINITEMRASAEPPPWLLSVPAAMAVVTAVMCATLPGYPLSARVVVDRKTLAFYRLLFAAGSTLLALPALLLVLTSDVNAFKGMAIAVAVASIALGAPSFATTFRALNMSMDDVVEGMANHVRVYRSMHLYRDEKLEALTRRSVRPWLADYLKESSEFFKLIGDVDPNVFELFVSFVFEVQRIKRKASMYMFVMLGATLIAPFLATATIRIGWVLGKQAISVLMGYATTLSFAFIASKLATGRNISTLLPGIATLIYASML